MALLCIFLLFFPSTLVVAQESAPPNIERLEELYAAESPEFLAEIDRLLALTTSASASRQLLRDFFERDATAVFDPNLAKRLVHLHELEGDYEAGRSLLTSLESETLLSGTAPLAVDLARLELELGNNGAAEEQLSRLTGFRVTRETLRQITILRCRISLIEGHESSFEAGIAALEREGWEDMALALRLQWAQKTGDRDEAARISEQLKEQYPLLWATLSSAEGRISRYPSPAMVMSVADQEAPTIDDVENSPESGSAPDTDTDTDTDSGEAAEGPPRPIGVQVGSFRDRENAEYMARDVRELGFSVSIRAQERGGDTYHQVVVTPGDATPQNTVVRLKEHGFEGFLIFD